MKAINYWITSDTHFGHANLVEMGIRKSGYEQILLRHFQDTIGHDDVLIHLGDVSFQDDHVWHTTLINGLPGKKWLVKGNHDHHSNSWYMSIGWDFVADGIHLNRFGHKILFSHAPRVAAGYDINIHGHLHEGLHHADEPEIIGTLSHKNYLIAVENNYKLQNLKIIIKEYKKRQEKLYA